MKIENEKQMTLIRIKRAAQITLPPNLRKQFDLNEGDYLEVEAVKDGILLKPVAVVARNPMPAAGKKATKKRSA